MVLEFIHIREAIPSLARCPHSALLPPLPRCLNYNSSKGRKNNLPRVVFFFPRLPARASGRAGASRASACSGRPRPRGGPATPTRAASRPTSGMGPASSRPGEMRAHEPIRRKIKDDFQLGASWGVMQGRAMLPRGLPERAASRVGGHAPPRRHRGAR